MSIDEARDLQPRPRRRVPRNLLDEPNDPAVILRRRLVPFKHVETMRHALVRVQLRRHPLLLQALRKRDGLVAQRISSRDLHH